MSAEAFDPEVFIGQLEARRTAFNAATDAAIEALRRLTSLSSGSGGSGAIGVSASVAGTFSVGPGEFFGLSVAEAAKRYLRIRRIKMTNKEIAEGLDSLGYIHNSKDLSNNIGTALWRAEQANDPDIFRQGRYWLLTEWTGGRKPRKQAETPDPGSEHVFGQNPEDAGIP